MHQGAGSSKQEQFGHSGLARQGVLDGEFRTDLPRLLRDRSRAGLLASTRSRTASSRALTSGAILFLIAEAESQTSAAGSATPEL